MVRADGKLIFHAAERAVGLPRRCSIGESKLLGCRIPGSRFSVDVLDVIVMNYADSLDLPLFATIMNFLSSLCRNWIFAAIIVGSLSPGAIAQQPIGQAPPQSPAGQPPLPPVGQNPPAPGQEGQPPQTAQRTSPIVRPGSTAGASRPTATSCAEAVADRPADRDSVCRSRYVEPSENLVEHEDHGRPAVF